jgi:hypothetical protein
MRLHRVTILFPMDATAPVLYGGVIILLMSDA